MQEPVVYLVRGKVSGILHSTKSTVLPPNVVLIFLSLLTNGAASRTGKREKEIDENLIHFRPLSFLLFALHIISQHIETDQ